MRIYCDKSGIVARALNVVAEQTSRGSPWSPAQCAEIVSYLSLSYIKHEYNYEPRLTEDYRKALHDEIIEREIFGRKRNKLTRAVRNLSETKK